MDENLTISDELVDPELANTEGDAPPPLRLDGDPSRLTLRITLGIVPGISGRSDDPSAPAAAESARRRDVVAITVSVSVSAYIGSAEAGNESTSDSIVSSVS